MEIFDFLKKEHDDFLEFSKSIVFEKKHPLHFNLMALYGSLIELSGSMIILLDNNGKIAVPSIFRTFLETYVEFHNLIRDPKYGYFMEYSHGEQWKWVLVEAKKGKNPYLSAISETPELDKVIATHKKELKELKKKGYKSLKVSEKFKKADMTEEYKSLYNFLCSESHSNMRALIGRHAEMSPEDFQVVYYRDEPIENFITYIDSAAGLLVGASLKLHEFFKSEQLENIKKLEKELLEIRNNYK